MHRIRNFAQNYPLIGPLLWVASVQYLLIQWVVASAWAPIGYSWLHNAISDLGATICGPYSGRHVCSPDHALMNASFVLLGITMIAGALLLAAQFASNRISRVGFAMLAIGGFGTLLVGIFPENVAPPLHGLGALLAFLVGDSAMIVLGLSLRLGWAMRWYSVISGIVGLSALVLYSLHAYLGIGLGGMERLAGYPQTLWLIIFGLYALRLGMQSREDGPS